MTMHITPVEPVRVLVNGETGAARDVLELTMAPGGGPPLHVHADQDETFVVLEGRLHARIGGETVEVGAGGAFHELVGPSPLLADAG